MVLRDYQQDLFQQVINTPAGINPLVQLDTGAGKTPLIGALLKHWRNEQVLVIAHRNILVAQASAQIARFGVKHNIIATKRTINACRWRHQAIGKSNTIKQDAQQHVVSIDSLLARHRHGRLQPIQPTRILIDEAHHVIRDNKWGRLAQLYPAAQIIGFTATPCRADGYGLSRTTNGLFDTLIQAAELKENSVRTLIDRGHLSPFAVYGINPQLNSKGLKIRAGDYDADQLAEWLDKSTLVGDAIKEYKLLASGTRCIVFSPRIKNAEKQAREFRQSGIAAAVIHSEMGDAHIREVMQDFDEKRILVLCSVDMIGEGYDCPEVSSIILQRKTLSYGLHRQQVGRVLRPAAGKTAVIIDQVGNTFMHGMPDDPVRWSLDRHQHNGKSNLIPCVACHGVMVAWVLKCPHCGAENGVEKAIAHPGSNSFIDFDVIDKPLVLAKIRAAREDFQRKNVLTIPAMHGSGILQTSTTRVREWLLEQVENHFTVEELNQFLEKTCDPSFWVKRFTVADIGKKNPNKCKNVVIECLK